MTLRFKAAATFVATALLTLAVAASMGLAANAAERPATNQVGDWCPSGGVKYEPISTPFVVPAPPDGTHWTLLVLKAGSGDGENATYPNPVPGQGYSHPSGKDNSHAILCYEPNTSTTTEASTTSSTTSTSAPTGSSSTTLPTSSTTTTTTVAPTTTQETSTTSLPPTANSTSTTDETPPPPSSDCQPNGPTTGSTICDGQPSTPGSCLRPSGTTGATAVGARGAATCAVPSPSGTLPAGNLPETGPSAVAFTAALAVILLAGGLVTRAFNRAGRAS